MTLSQCTFLKNTFFYHYCETRNFLRKVVNKINILGKCLLCRAFSDLFLEEKAGGRERKRNEKRSDRTTSQELSDVRLSVARKYSYTLTGNENVATEIAIRDIDLWKSIYH